MTAFRVATIVAAMLGAMLLPATTSFAQKKPTPKPPAKKPPATVGIVGRDQQAGGEGVFGKTYSLNGRPSGYGTDFNVTLVSAAYSAMPDPVAGGLKADDKFVVMRWRLKSTRPSVEHYLFEGALPMTMVDATGQSHTGYAMMWRESDRQKLKMAFKPGQGVDDAVGAVRIPAKAKITKIILNVGRAGTKEEVIRFPVDGKTNKIASLPTAHADPSDPTGATARAEFPVKIGEEAPLFGLSFKPESFALTDQPVAGKTPPTGKQFLVVTATLTNLMPTDLVLSSYGEGMKGTVKDADGEDTTTMYLMFYKASRDEKVEGDKAIAPGQSYRVRLLVPAPKGVALKTASLRFDQGDSHAVLLDVSSVK
jgi:hypothetical protein